MHDPARSPIHGGPSVRSRRWLDSGSRLTTALMLEAMGIGGLYSLAATGRGRIARDALNCEGQPGSSGRPPSGGLHRTGIAPNLTELLVDLEEVEGRPDDSPRRAAQARPGRSPIGSPVRSGWSPSEPRVHPPLDLRTTFLRRGPKVARSRSFRSPPRPVTPRRSEGFSLPCLLPPALALAWPSRPCWCELTGNRHGTVAVAPPS
jgi:hypothetical protein